MLCVITKSWNNTFLWCCRMVTIISFYSEIRLLTWSLMHLQNMYRIFSYSSYFLNTDLVTFISQTYIFCAFEAVWGDSKVIHRIRLPNSKYLKINKWIKYLALNYAALGNTRRIKGKIWVRKTRQGKKDGDKMGRKYCNWGRLQKKEDRSTLHKLRDLAATSSANIQSK